MVKMKNRKSKIGKTQSRKVKVLTNEVEKVKSEVNKGRREMIWSVRVMMIIHMTKGDWGVLANTYHGLKKDKYLYKKNYLFIVLLLCFPTLTTFFWLY